MKITFKITFLILITLIAILTPNSNDLFCFEGENLSSSSEQMTTELPTMQNSNMDSRALSMNSNETLGNAAQPDISLEQEGQNTTQKDISGKILRVGVEPLLSNLFSKFTDNFRHQISYSRINNYNDRYDLIRKICNQNDEVSILILSKPINSYEKNLCTASGGSLIEKKIGYYAFVFVESSENKNDGLEFSRSMIFHAMHDENFSKDSKEKNSYTKWSEISKIFPDREIKIYGLTSDIPEFSFLSDNLVTRPCMSSPYNQEQFDDFKKLYQFCNKIRTDGVYVGDNIDGRLTIQKVLSEIHSYGIIAYNIYLKYKDSLLLKAFDGVDPTRENILSENYGLSYPIYVYYRSGSTNSLTQDFLKDIDDKNVIGANGYMTDYGLISLEE